MCKPASAMLAVTLACCLTGGSQAFGQDDRLDVNDVSILWPVPKTKADVAALISLDETAADGAGPILTQRAFDTLLRTAKAADVTNSAGQEVRINFQPFEAEFANRAIWKVAAVRVDPSAPGTDPMFTKAFGTIPQVRLIAQPVTVDDAGKVRVHDVTAHLVFNFVSEFRPPASGMGLPVGVPDKDKFAQIVADLRALKGSLKDAGVTTTGNLSVHPGLRGPTSGFAERVKGLLRKHLRDDRLAAMAFMGLFPPEPWVFSSVRRRDGAFEPLGHPSIGNASAQMLNFRGGKAVMPEPKNTNVDTARGVSTAILFPGPSADKLDQPVFPDLPKLRLKDVPDLIANPQRAHFFNTDCVSCHSESARRKNLNLDGVRSEFRFIVPDGVSGVDEAILPVDPWNVRNFGWFPARGGRPAAATATMRTANEAAESADFINREYPAPSR